MLGTCIHEDEIFGSTSHDIGIKIYVCMNLIDAL